MSGECQREKNGCNDKLIEKKIGLFLASNTVGNYKSDCNFCL